MSLVFDFLTGVGGYLIAAVIAALGILGYGQAKKREGRKEAEDDAAQDTLDRFRKGQDALGDDDGGAPDERVRRNDGRW